MMRMLCILLMVLLLLPFSAIALTVAAISEVPLETPQGTLIGVSAETGRDVVVFKGIPYAVSPVGERRWKLAEPAPAWKGERYAKAFAPACMQPPQGAKSQGLFYQPALQDSEDCLYLNVWAPKKSGQARPVMVWIHGGALTSGSASTPFTDGTELAKKGVVFVTIQNRLGVFGYFSHPELTAESPHRASGNYGTTDQIQALKWVQENINAFGGDPDNVTIIGNSAGGLSVSHLMASPLAKGLFHKAIMQSGYLPPMPVLKESRYGLLSAEAKGLNIAARTGEKSLAALRAMTAKQLLLVGGGITELTETAVDGWVFTEQIFETFEQNKQHDVPLLIGFNSGEGTHLSTYGAGLLPTIPLNRASYISAVKARYGELAEEYLSLYPFSNRYEAQFDPIRHGSYGWAAEKFARTTGNVRSKVYLYYFDYAFPWAEKMNLGAFHASDVIFVLNNVKRNLKFVNWPTYLASKADIHMADIISNYWVAFAKKGAPQVKGQPTWRDYTEKARHYMVFDKSGPKADIDLDPGVYEFHEKVIAMRRARGDMSWNFFDIGLDAPVLSDPATQ